MSSCKEILNRSTSLLKQHAKISSFTWEFGTAGFRAKGETLDHVMFRMGILAVLRSKDLKRTIGVMVTASHNPEIDNGVKLIDPAGEMLASTWEKYATIVANSEDQELPSVLDDLISKENISLSQKSSVFVARDTRKSSPTLTNAVIDGIRCMDGEFYDYGIMTTPMLHYMVVCENTTGQYGQPTNIGYYSKIAIAFKNLVCKKPIGGNYKPILTVDGSNGVGAIAMKEFIKELNDALQMTLVNDGSNGILNHECGADFVKVNQKGYCGIQPVVHHRYASLDGDADRLIYFYYDKDLKFHMLDGDKIAVLLADYLGGLVKQSNISINLGIVQTAYANGSSTNYINDVLGIPVSFTPTGVKHLHHEAIKYDIGIYFEANGHGTVVFSDKAIALITNAAKNLSNAASIELANFMQLINSTVGDAISDMLTIEAILRSKGWNAEDWDKMYTDLPNRLSKVSIKDRSLVGTTDAERICIKPDGLQAQINSLVSKYKNGRSFVRPSGTEDIIRVYAEADTSTNADKLAAEVSLAVYELCSGVGAKPTIPN